MFTMRARPGVGLMTLLLLSAASSPVPTLLAAKPIPPTEPVVRYTLQLIPLPSGSTSGSASGLNNRGDVVGTANLPDDTQAGFVYRAAGDVTIDLNDLILNDEDIDIVVEPEAWPTLPEGQRWPDGARIASATGINDSGQIVGSFYLWDNRDPEKYVGRYHAFRYTPAGFDGVGEPLPAEFRDLSGRVDGYDDSSAAAINSLGDVVGQLSYQGPGFVWIAAEDNLMVVDDDTINAQDISNFGEIAGTMFVGGERRAFRYTPGLELLNLGVLGRSKSGSSYSIASGINSAGQVVGKSSAPKVMYQRGFWYSDQRGMVNLGALEGGSLAMSEAKDINSSGHIVGISSTLGDGLHPFLYTEATGMLDLWSLVINLPAGFVTRDVRYELSINDFPGHKFGQICGTTLMDEPFVLTPDR